MTTLLQVRNLKKSFDGTKLLDIDRFHVDAGECVVLSGRNGSGKSTLLRIISGLMMPDSAEFIDGNRSLSWSAARGILRRVAIYVHQQPYMLDRTVAGNIAYGLRRAGVANGEVAGRVAAALDWAGLKRLADRNARTLSGGEKQRVALSRARVLSPKLLLLDEPTSNMDIESREQTIELIRRLRDDGISTIVATHEPRTAQLIGDRQQHLCVSGPARCAFVEPFLYNNTAAQELDLSQPDHLSCAPDTPTAVGHKETQDTGILIAKNVSAVILAGGEARHMGGGDKALIDLNGRPMIESVIAAIEPQVGKVLISANRNRDRYQTFGFSVVTDMLGDSFGPLVGMASALQYIDTPFLLTVPCDAPLIRADLVTRLYAALQNKGAELSVAHDGERMQPVFALLRRDLLPSLLAYLQAGGRKIDTWYSQHQIALAEMSQFPEMFWNINTPEDKATVCRKLAIQRRGSVTYVG